jgi:hypothetical protein
VIEVIGCRDCPFLKVYHSPFLKVYHSFYSTCQASKGRSELGQFKDRVGQHYWNHRGPVYVPNGCPLPVTVVAKKLEVA